ncbi:MAG: hypothetical protein KAV82_08550 [Phycisphaerae bacterium]|nr:hypothetical protein [Phycisphaerae bacterium]
MTPYTIRLPHYRFLTGLVLFAMVSTSAWGQPRGEEKGDAPPARDRRAPHDYDRYHDDRYIDYDSEPPYDYYERHWRRQARDYTRSRHRSSRWSRDYYRERSYGPRGYRPYHEDRYGGWGYGDYGHGGHTFDRGYWEGHRDGRRFADWERRAEMGRRSYADAMNSGLRAFRNGEYPAAVRDFIRAAKVNQGDPASRIHAAHALVAIGRYPEALPALRRAFQLQPKIAYLALDIRRDYGAKADFQAHLKGIEDAAEKARNDPGLWLLLGYYQFFSARETAALASLTRSNELAPGDFLTEALLAAARMVAPVPGHPPHSEESGKGAPAPQPGKTPEATPGYGV